MGRPQLNPELVAAAGLTPRQVECLEWRLADASWNFIGRQLDVDRTTAREHVRKATAAIATALEEGYPEKELLAA